MRKLIVHNKKKLKKTKFNFNFNLFTLFPRQFALHVVRPLYLLAATLSSASLPFLAAVTSLIQCWLHNKTPKAQPKVHLSLYSLQCWPHVLLVIFTKLPSLSFFLKIHVPQLCSLIFCWLNCSSVHPQCFFCNSVFKIAN